jgi:hypothetical protein
MVIIITVAVLGVAMLLIAVSYVLLRDVRTIPSFALRGAIVAVLWAAALGIGIALAGC